MEIKWSFLARKKLKEIFNYYKIKVNFDFAQNFILKITNATINLDKFPNKGQIEESLAHRKEEFRYLIEGNYKIIYQINISKKHILIVNIFDTRQNPNKILQDKV